VSFDWERHELPTFRELHGMANDEGFQKVIKSISGFEHSSVTNTLVVILIRRKSYKVIGANPPAPLIAKLVDHLVRATYAATRKLLMQESYGLRHGTHMRNSHDETQVPSLRIRRKSVNKSPRNNAHPLPNSMQYTTTWTAYPLGLE
jgi:hypothetical protein